MRIASAECPRDERAMRHQPSRFTPSPARAVTAAAREKPRARRRDSIPSRHATARAKSDKNREERRPPPSCHATPTECLTSFTQCMNMPRDKVSTPTIFSSFLHAAPHENDSACRMMLFRRKRRSQPLISIRFCLPPLSSRCRCCL